MGLFDSLVERGQHFSDLNRYVSDYRIVEEKDRKGRVRKKAVYVGAWISIRDFDAGKSRVLWGVLALSILNVLVYGYMALLTHASSGQFWVMLPILAGLFPCLYLMMGATSLPFRGKPMRRDQYMHSFIRVFRSAVAVAAFAAVGLLASLVDRAVRGDWLFLRSDWVFAVSAVACAVLSLLVILLLRTLDVRETAQESSGMKNDGWKTE